MACLIGSYLTTSYKVPREFGVSKRTSGVGILVLDHVADAIVAPFQVFTPASSLNQLTQLFSTFSTVQPTSLLYQYLNVT
jgi:hypothetical protein